jgi:hypothetical protein
MTSIDGGWGAGGGGAGSDVVRYTVASEANSGRRRLTLGQIGDVFHVDKLVLYIEAVWCTRRTIHSARHKGDWSSRSGRVISWYRDIVLTE